MFGYCIYECGVIYIALVGVSVVVLGGGGNPLPMGREGVLN